MGVVSSRTPEGYPGRCPVCGHDCRLDPSSPLQDGPCPACGHLLLFGPADLAVTPDGVRDVLLRIGEARFGRPPKEARWALGGVASRADLQAMIDRLMDASSWAEVMATG